MPILRADVELLETHERVEVEPLDCPITVLGGVSDPAISKAMLSGWQVNTLEAFSQHEFEGGHFYIHAERDKVISVLVNHLL